MIQQQFFLPLVQHLKECTFILNMSGLPKDHWNAILRSSFMGAPLLKHLRDLGVKIERVPTGASASAGMVERQQSLRSVLHHCNLPLTFWPHLLEGVIYTYNRTPHTGVAWRAPYEAMYGRDTT